MSIKVNAARPNMPLSPWFSFAGSPTSIRILDIPKQISSWNITSVKVIAKYPDNRNVEREAIRNGCVWVVTIEGCDISGKVSNGYEIVADGLDEQGQEVIGYVLGCGDIYIMDRDVSIQKNIEKYNVRYCDELPTNPAKGDLIYHNGNVRLFNGSEWLTLGIDPQIIEGIDNRINEVASSIPTKTSQLNNDSDFATNASVDEKIGGVTSSIPTKVSQLQNDSDFSTNASVDEKIGGVTSSIPTKTSQLQNDSDFSTNASVDEKIGGVTSSIPTKVSQIENDSGYTTQAYVDNAIGNVLTQEEF